MVIIQTPTLVVGASAMMLFKGLYGKKCVINVSDIWPLTAVDMGAMKEGSRSYRFMQWCEHYMYRKCDGVLGQSEEILNHVAQEMVLLGCGSTVGVQEANMRVKEATMTMVAVRLKLKVENWKLKTD